MILRKYGESATINFSLYEVDGIDFRVDAVHASGDTVIMKDEGAEANTTNSFTDEGTGYSLVLTATEMQAARIVIYVIDQTATKVWLDHAITIETYGNASAQHAFDLDTASTAQTADHTAAIADIPTVSEFNARTLLAANYFDFTTDQVIVTTNNDKTGYTASTVTDKTGYTVDTVNDKTGYALTQTFPTNFEDLAISLTTGEVTVGTNNDKTGYTVTNEVTANVVKINGVTVIGAGTSGDLWRA